MEQSRWLDALKQMLADGRLTRRRDVDGQFVYALPAPDGVDIDRMHFRLDAYVREAETFTPEA